MSAGDRVIMESIEGNYATRLEQAERDIEDLRATVLRLTQMDHATADLGSQNANELTFPSFVADEEGIYFPEIGDGINLANKARISSAHDDSGNAAMRIDVFDLLKNAQIETNGGFEDGTLTGWTTAGTTTPAVSTEETAKGSLYSCKLVGGATVPYIQQVITLPTGAGSALRDGIFVKFWRNCTAQINVTLFYLDSSDAQLYYEDFYFNPTTNWALGTCGLRPTLISGLIAKLKVRIQLSSTNSSLYGFVDEIAVFANENGAYASLMINSATTGMEGNVPFLRLRDGEKKIIDGNSDNLTLVGLDLKNIYLFGDGSDGDVTISSTVTLTRDMNYNKLTITGSGVLKTNGFIIRVHNTLNIYIGGVIDCSGGDGGNGGTGVGAGGAGGSAAYSGIRWLFPIPTDGAQGEGVTVASTTNGAAKISPVPLLNTALEPYTWMAGGGGSGGAAHGTSDGSTNVSTEAIAGPRAGHGGAATGTGSSARRGGGGGGGAGVILIYVKNLLNYGTIRANGGNGGNGATSVDASGNGGGGSGGAVIIFYRQGTLGTREVNGGNAGTGGNGGTSGTLGRSVAYLV